ncbi:MAG: ABATE domain-containing protein [Chloroflexota bacterium]
MPIGGAGQSSHAAPHGHQASLKDGLAFVNTLEFDRGRVKEHLPTVEAALAWLFDHSLLHRETRDELLGRLAGDPTAETRALRRIGRVRAAIRELVVASVERRPPSARALGEVNRALRVHYVTYLLPAPDGVSLTIATRATRSRGHGLLAESVAREPRRGAPSGCGCENPDCRWGVRGHVALGPTEMATRHADAVNGKVARHRQRRREGHAPSPEVRQTPAVSQEVRPFEVVVESVPGMRALRAWSPGPAGKPPGEGRGAGGRGSGALRASIRPCRGTRGHRVPGPRGARGPEGRSATRATRPRSGSRTRRGADSTGSPRRRRDI